MGIRIISNKYGREAEAWALKFLKQQSFEIHSTNYNTRYGEIDIIAIKDKTLVFTEVKARRQHSSYDVITNAKVRKICKTALNFLAENPNFESYDMRFDLLHIVGNGVHEHIENAWDFVE